MEPKLTKKQLGFAKDYLETGNGTQSILKNYDTEDPHTASVMAVENLSKPSVMAYLQSKSSDVAAVVYQLAMSAENEGVRLNASKDILDRTGFKPTEKHEVVGTLVPGEETKEMIDKAISSYLNK